MNSSASRPVALSLDAEPEVPRLRPAFLVVGAQKAGTSSLHTWLAALPGMALPRDKETHYLTHPERTRLGADWYADQFEVGGGGSDHSAHLLGEVDPELLHHPLAARRVRAVFGAPKIVVVLRNPVERARSQHAMSVARGLEQLPFPVALERESERLRGTGPDSKAARHYSYLERSRYGRDVQRYLDRFGKEGVLLLRFEDLFAPLDEERRRRVFQGLLDFVGYSGPLRLERPNEVHNGRWEPRSQSLARLLHGEGALRRALGKLVPGRALRRHLGLWLDAFNRRAPDPTRRTSAVSPGPAALPDRWREVFNREVRAVESLTGWDCTDWLQDDSEDQEPAPQGGWQTA